MCYFITIAVPSNLVTEVRVAVPRGFQLANATNKSVVKALPAKYVTLLLTSGGCSCDLFRPDRAEGPPEETSQLKEKYEKLGWSNAKIERAIRQSKNHRGGREPFMGFRSDVLGIFIAIAGMVPRFALFVHQYSEEMLEEAIDLQSPQYVAADQMSDFIPSEDRLIWIERRPHEQPKR